MIRVYDETGNVIETYEHKGEFKDAQNSSVLSGLISPALAVTLILLPWRCSGNVSLSHSASALQSFSPAALMPSAWRLR